MNSAESLSPLQNLVFRLFHIIVMLNMPCFWHLTFLSERFEHQKALLAVGTFARVCLPFQQFAAKLHRGSSQPTEEKPNKAVTPVWVKRNGRYFLMEEGKVQWALTPKEKVYLRFWKWSRSVWLDRNGTNPGGARHKCDGLCRTRWTRSVRWRRQRLLLTFRSRPDWFLGSTSISWSCSSIQKLRWFRKAHFFSAQPA